MSEHRFKEKRRRLWWSDEGAFEMSVVLDERNCGGGLGAGASAIDSVLKNRESPLQELSGSCKGFLVQN
ncbi:hypothetical protein V6N12_056042 [Hibiscus sabdariffa]|uniref:Uncharacterized protein n=1 Tax=Hibiscus sabdariffa TaxID=183260 RepID=A0ABR2CT35_9ROSI